MNEIVLEKKHNFGLDMVMKEITYLSKSNSLQYRGEKFFTPTESGMNKGNKKMPIQTSFLEKNKKHNFEKGNKKMSYKKFPGETNFEKKSSHENEYVC